MNGQALYRRWRSQTFDEIIAQEHVTRTLQNALRGERIAHAYLFCGPRGTGKTSTARILAKAANCLAEPAERPCNRCARCQAITEGRDLDLIEIDAASNRGIDEIRDLRDKISFAPNEGRYKVYVIDEVHMLTTEAFNALLKTLEEPPPHVIFVLATTEPQRIPATILSRCQRFDFRRIPVADLAGKLRHISEVEHIRIQPEAIEAIARRAGGSFRDGESLLDQLAAYGDEEITLERVRDLLGGVSASVVAELAQAWVDEDLGEGLRLINRLVDEGVDAHQLLLEAIEHLRGLLLLAAGGDEKLAGASPEMLAEMRRQATGAGVQALVDALRIFGEAAHARGEARPQLPLELALAQAILARAPQSLSVAPQPAAAPAPVAVVEERPAPKVDREAAPRPAAEEKPAARTEREEAPARHQPSPRHRTRRAPERAQGERTKGQRPAAEALEVPAAPATGVTVEWLAEKWPDVLQHLRGESKMLEALLRSGRPCALEGNRVVLEMEGEFHKGRVMEEKNRRTVEEVLARFVGVPCQVECVLQGQRPPKANPRQTIQEDPLVRYAVRDLGAEASQLQDTGES